MLRLRHLTVGYGAFLATHELNLQVREGTVFALVGANGAGKSSTIMSIAGHVDVFGGSVEFDGIDITRKPIHERIREGIALAPEGRRLFSDLSVRENLTIGGYVRPKAEEASFGSTLVISSKASEGL